MAEYTLPELPYDYSALEPSISGTIMELHHCKHHQAYVTGANTALAKLAEARDKGDFANVNKLEKDLAFNLGGHVNHSIFWTNMSPGRRRQADRRAGLGDRRPLRLVRQVPGALHRGRTGRAGLRLGRAGLGLDRPAPDHPAVLRPAGNFPAGTIPLLHAGRLGARLLPRLQERPGRLRQGVLEHRQLGERAGALHGGSREDRRACCYCRSGWCGRDASAATAVPHQFTTDSRARAPQ